MVNIVIKEPDILLQRGLTFLFSDFSSQYNTKVDFNFNFTSESMKVADAIVLALCPGECFICCPEPQERKRGIAIGVADDDTRVTALPLCFQDTIFTSRRDSIMRLRIALHGAWHRLQQTNTRQLFMPCCDCQPTRLSPQQICIMTCLYEGMSVTQIADELIISKKTVYVYKYMVIRESNLRNDYELMLLLNKLIKSCTWPGGFINI